MDGKTTQILLVEDEEDHAELIRRAFRADGSRVELTVATTLREARERLAASIPDLVIADIRLPDDNGIDILPADGGEVSFPVVVLTAHGDEDVAVEAMKRGAIDYVVKSEATLADAPRIARRALREWGHITERKRAEEALEKAHDELEERVRERTAELAAANRQLSEEVAERKLAEDALRVSEERFRLAFEDGPLGMAIFSPDRRFLDANRALCDMLGYTCEELLGQEIAGVAHPDDRQICLEVSQQVFDGEIPSGTWESRYLDKQGQIVWGRVTASAVRNRKGQMMYGLAMVENVTERKLAEKRMETLRTQLAHMGRVATMGEMASGIAHEINQPLAAIVTRAEVGARRIDLRKNDSKTRQRDLLQFIADQAYRAGEIIRRMRNFMKRSEPRRTTVDMAELISEVLVLAGNDLQQAGIAVTCDLDHSLPTTLADKIQVQQVLLNLIRNSLEAMDGTPPDARKLSIRATRRDGPLEVAVCDTGCGIPHHGDDLFEAFQGSKPDGMGMGLAISRSIVEAHGGRIWAAPNPDAGATFTFTLPITEEDPEE